MVRSPKVKFIRDPVHDLIRVDDFLLLELIDSAAFQRLRKIRQLGLACLVYPGAEHSRFTHSLGAYHLAQRVLNYLLEHPLGKGVLDDGSRRLVLIAALLHDIGHGPFSHLFEGVFRDWGMKEALDHEGWTKRIILEDREVNRIVRRIDRTAPMRICDLLTGAFKPRFLSDLISSQLDVDRFDYLLRDAHMTGAQYGRFDREWLLRTLTLVDVNVVSPFGDLGEDHGLPETKVAIETRRGMNALEQHLLGRHYMYRNVYYHKTIRAAEGMLRVILKRASVLIRDGARMGNKVLRKLAQGKEVTTSEYMSLNDFTVLAWIDEWASSRSDKTLRDLSVRLRKREIFATIVIPEEWDRGHYYDKRRQVEEFLQSRGLDPSFYLINDEAKDLAYKDYFWFEKKGKPPKDIWCVNHDGEGQRLDSKLFKQAEAALQYKEERWYVPRECGDEIRSLIGLPPENR